MYLWLSSRPSAFLRYPWAPQGSSETCQWAASPKVSNICFIHEQFSDLNTAKAFNWCLQYSAFEGLLQFFVVRLGFSWGKVLPTLQEILDSVLYRKRTERCALLLCWLPTPLSEFDDNPAVALVGYFENPTQYDSEIFWPQRRTQTVLQESVKSLGNEEEKAFLLSAFQIRRVFLLSLSRMHILSCAFVSEQQLAPWRPCSPSCKNSIGQQPFLRKILHATSLLGFSQAKLWGSSAGINCNSVKTLYHLLLFLFSVIA